MRVRIDSACFALAATFVLVPATASSSGDPIQQLRRRLTTSEVDSARALVRQSRTTVPEVVSSLLADRARFLVAHAPDSAATCAQQALRIAELYAGAFDDSLCIRMVREHGDLSAAALPAIVSAWERYREVRQLDEDSQWKLSVPRLPELLQSARTSGDPYIELHARRLTGRCLYMTASFDAAREEWQRALDLARQLRDHDGELWLRGRIGLTLQVQNRLDDAGRMLSSTIADARQLGDLELVAWALARLGNVLFLKGDLDAARTTYEEALSLAREHGAPAEETRIRINLGNVLSQFGEYEQALQLQEDALAMIRQGIGGNRRTEVSSLTTMAIIYVQTAQYSRALATLAEALPLAEAAGTLDQVATISNQMGEVYFLLGRPADALRHYESSLPLLRKSGMQNYEAQAQRDIGWVHAEAGRFEAAIIAFEAAHSIGETTGNRLLLAQARCDLGWVHLERGSRRVAEQHLIRALADAQSLGNPILQGNAERCLGRLYAADGDPQRAAAFFGRAVQHGQLHRSQALLEEALVDRAHFEQQRGALAAADSLLATSITIVEAVRGQQSGERVRTGFLSKKKRIYSRRVGILHAIGLGQEGHSPAFETAFQVAESGRAKSLLDIVSRSGADPPEQAGPALRQRQRKLKAQLGTLQTEVSKAAAAESWVGARVDSLERLLEQTGRDYGAVVEEVAAYSPSYGALFGQKRPLTLREVRERVLAPDQILLEYLTGETESFIFLVGHDRFHLERIPAGADTLAARVQGLRASVLGPDAAEGNLAQDLYGLLIQPVADQIPSGSRLLLVPDGPLFYLPFAVLHDGTHRLCERYALAYAPSATFLDPDLRVTKRVPRRRLLAVGNPESFRAEAISSPTRDATRWRFAELPYAAEEVHRVTAFFKHATGLTGRAATEEAFKSGAIQATHLHLATHGFVDDHEPMLSGLVLAQDEDPAEDGFLQAHEILNLNLAADLVALSACNTGLGPIAGGEGVLGLSWAFLHAGARTLLVSLWEVGDRTAVDLVDSFYRAYIREGDRIDVALQQAQRTCIAAGTPVRDWAPFIVLGATDPARPERDVASRIALLAGGVVVLVALGAVWRLVRLRILLNRHVR